MTKQIGVILFCLFCLSGLSQAQSIDAIRKNKEKSEKEISYLNKLLEDTKNSKSVSIEKLGVLQQKIIQGKEVLSSLNKEVKYLEGRIASNEARISELQADKSSMLDLYAKLIYGTWKKRNKANKMMFIFSSSDFNQAYNRFKYFQQIQEYSKRQLKLIEQVNDSLDMKNKELKKFVDEKNNTLTVINVKNKELLSEQANENLYVKDLQKKEKELAGKLKTEMKNREKLANELNKLIARQNKKSGSSSSAYKLTPEEKLVSDDFVKNRGKLPWPVTEGFISEKFGINKHPVLVRITTSNDGVNITSSKNANVRAVFQGTVSEILFMPGFNNVVIIRHGNYMTVYTNLLDVTVQKGQKVKTKDLIGKIAFDDEKGSILNFQVWKDLEKLNPELWLAK